jgi:hypothetical protein
LRANLDVIAKLPDAVSNIGDKTSAIIATTRQVLDLIDGNAKSGKPFTDGSGNGKKVLDLVQAAMGDGRSEVFAATVADVCQ